MIHFNERFLKSTGYFAILFSSFSILQVQSASDIQIERDFNYTTIDDFTVYWNVPTFMCHKHKINFQDVLGEYHIEHNFEDRFKKGSRINILFNPGSFPHMKGSKSFNGAIPQKGDLNKHFNAFRSRIEKLIPQNFSGLAVIDFKLWRPIYRQNWSKNNIYKELSREYIRDKNPDWKEAKIEQKAEETFEVAARKFMEETLKLAKELRPEAKWGYHTYPECLNYRPNNNMEAACPSIVREENDRIQWLYKESTAIYPSLYLSAKLDTEDRRKSVIGRLNEAWRVTSKVSFTKFPPVYAYIKLRYHGHSPNYLSEEDLYNSLSTAMKYKMGGAVIYAVTKDVNSNEKCNELLTYLKDTLGPTALKVKKESEITSEE